MTTLRPARTRRPLLEWVQYDSEPFAWVMICCVIVAALVAVGVKG